MANGNLGSYAVTLPNVFQAPGQALQSATEQVQRQGENLAQMQMRQQEAAERKAEREETQLYRKMQTIQELSDLSKYQTANDVANAIGNKSANDIKAKYITLAKEGKVGLADIMEGVNKEISSTTEGMNALKMEGESFENLFKALKTQFPDLDATALLTDYRKDVTGRRLKDGTSFINPIEVKQSDLVTNLSNPDYLSKYMRGGKNLTEAITAPKGMEKSSVFVGTPTENVKFEATIPFWKRPTFTPEQAPGGFLQKGMQPSLEIKASTLPPEAIPSSSKVPFKVIDTEVYDRFSQEPKTNLELIQATRDKFPGYDQFNPTEKEYAKRNVLFDKLSTLDQSQFYPTGSTRAPITNINVPKEEKGLDGLNWVKNFTSAVDSKNISSAIGEARKLFAGAGGKYEFKDLKIAPDGGMSFEYYPTIDGVSDKSEVLREKISPTDPNKNYKIANLYQKITGQDVKMERKILGGKDDFSTQKPKPVDPSKFVKGKTYTYNNKNYVWDGKNMIEQ
jgi:hypothetical protein